MSPEATGYETLTWKLEDRVATITLTRPEIHNAFNDTMIAELTEVYTQLADDPSARIVVLTGTGRSFCAGADLHWMKKMIGYSFEENLEDSLKLAELMHRMYTHPRPTIARVNGATIGGGTGLVAACDIAIAAESAFFSLSEVRIGIVPACIGPYVVKRVGESRARELMLSGERVPAARAADIGLVNAAVSNETLDAEIRRRIDHLLSCGPEAQAACKRLIEGVASLPLEELKAFTAEMIARLRISDEGQEGMNAFLSKRKPSWTDGGGR
jgi:methylglutaconyl-CoA hydratase